MNDPQNGLRLAEAAARKGPARRFWERWQQGTRPDVRVFLAEAGPLAPLEVLAVLRVDQQERWRRGERLLAEEYLGQHTALHEDPERALDLVYGEFLLREQLGEAPSLAEYVNRFPQFADELSLQVRFHRVFDSDPAEDGEAPTPGADRPTIPAAPVEELRAPDVPGYEILGCLGRGGMGVVYKARQVALNRLVALKTLAVCNAAFPDLRARFRAEAEAVARLQHPNIVQIHEVGEHAGRPYFSMELVEGGSLDQRLNGTPLPARDAARLTAVLAGAIHAAHACGVVHRDLKPANILLQRTEDRGQRTEGASASPLSPVLCPLSSVFCPKITDFGLAKRLDRDGGQTYLGALLGTPNYMAPEQAEGRSNVGPAADVYALGAILYELLTGRPPFVAATVLETLDQVRSAEPVPPRRLQPGLPRDLETICLKCLHKEPPRRYATARELAEELDRFLADRPIRARPVGPVGRLRRWCRRSPVLASLAALLLVTFLTGFGGVTWKWQEAEQAREAERQARQEADRRAEEVRQGLERMKAANALVTRGWHYREGDHWDNAEADFTRAVRLRPEDSRVWLERTQLYARLGLWELAAPDLAKAFALQEPAVPWGWHHHALLRLQVGDAPGYRQLCARMRERFAGTTNVGFADVLVRTCALAPPADSDPTWLVELQQSLLPVDPTNPWLRYVLGFAHYRAGQFEQAVQRCHDSLTMSTDWQLQATNGPILAMAHHRLGQDREAQAALAEAAKALEQAAQGMYQGAVGFWPIAWWDWLESQLLYREAREQLGLPPPPDDPRVRFLRGRALSYLQRRAEAAPEFAAALRLGLNEPRVHREAHRNQAHYHIHRREWDKVPAEFAQAVGFEPEMADLWHSHALAQQAAGNAEGYRQVCTTMLRRFEKTTDPETANLVVQACVLTPDAAADAAALVALARVAVPWKHGNVRCLGAALYRAGRHAEAVECFYAAARVTRPSAWDWLFLAMAHHHLRHGDEARRCLARADEWVREANQPDANDLSGTQPTWDRWFERIEVEVLRREAETLLGNGR